MSKTNPLADTLNASWLGQVKNRTPTKREEKDAVTTYQELDDQHYRLLDLYGPQEPPQRSRRGRQDKNG